MAKFNYQIEYVGLAEGYDISKVEYDVDGYEVYATFSEAKREAARRVKQDIELVRDSLSALRKLKKSDVL